MEQLINSLITTLIGMTVVLVSLIVIILFILLINKIIALFTNERNKKRVEPITEIPNDSVINDEDSQQKLVAAITAALTVSAYSGTNTRFVVKKIKKL